VTTADYLQFLSVLKPSAPDPLGAGLTECVERFLTSGARRGEVIIVSDFWLEPARVAHALARLTRAGFQASLLHVLAAEEIAPRELGWLRLHEAEAPEPLALWCGAEHLQRYVSELERHREELERAIRRHAGRYLCARSDLPLESALVALLRQQRWVV
jgi:hypothetical protein